MKNKKRQLEKLSLRKSVIAGLTQHQLAGGSSYLTTFTYTFEAGCPHSTLCPTRINNDICRSNTNCPI